MIIRKLAKLDVVTIAPEASVLEAARVMRSEHVGDVVVTGPGRRPIGILTDRDIVVSVLAQDVEHLGKLAVKDVLTPDPVIAYEDEDTESVLMRMRRHGVRRMPVVNREGALIGVFAVDDLLAMLALDLSTIVAVVEGQRRREQSRRP
jgi:CBS domain-containing protein